MPIPIESMIFCGAQLQEHIAFLEELEDGLSDSNGHLREDLLIERVQRDPRWTFQAGNRIIETLGLSLLELPIPAEGNITCIPPKLGSGNAHGVDAGIHVGSQ